MSALGRHILVELYGCNPKLLNDVVHIEKSMEEAAAKANATLINSTFHHFSPYGVSGVVVIEESHFAIHTWPEYQFASVDLFTCGPGVDPWVSFDYLREALVAEHQSAMEMCRGELQLLQKVDFRREPLRDQKSLANGAPRRSRDIWFTERNENLALSLRHSGEKLFEAQSDLQKVEVFHTFAYGNMLVLDGMVMCTEKDEYAYHEMIVHVPMLTHPAAQRILVIGGGDGGTVRELVKHPGLQKVDLIEIDHNVLEACKLHLPNLAQALDNPKVNVKIQDGIEFVQTCADQCYDVVIVDSTDPVGPGEGLFTADFYQQVYRILKEDGLMVTQSESPRFNSKVFVEIFTCYKEIFGPESVHPYLAFIPTYPTGMWSFSLCAKGSLHPVHDFDESRLDPIVEGNPLSYYNPEIHRSAFALPNFVKTLLEGEVGVNHN